MSKGVGKDICSGKDKADRVSEVGEGRREEM